MNQLADVLTAEALRPSRVQDGCTITSLLDDHPLPLLIASQEGQSIHTLSESLRTLAIDALSTTGGVLLRNFKVPTPLDFKRFAASFGMPLGTYEFGSTPRSKVFAGVYSSTEYPAHQSIPLHNEQSYTRQWPSRIWFHCMTPSQTGGETPIADSRQVYQAIDPAIREEFIAKGLLYVRNYSSALDLPWQQVFNTDDRVKVEQYCQSQGIDWNWSDDGELSTRQLCQAAIRHPASQEWVWFNQAHLFHISAMEQNLRQALIDAVGEAQLPRNVYFGDGTPIPDATLDAIRTVYAQTCVAFPWQAGDVLMLDNLLVAHGRNPFSGDRKVIVAMA
ncbi:MAG: TauD/TfdA family dioxygenase [Pseudomonas sp.]|nr:TauD/TfdA family dioxygenase [Pseudomonas sp. B11D7D]MDN5513855.1 TauD/TfdA family dioxygenase [Pseudomonas sp.]QNH03782.1 TauD/TfdA family dioxygenase [Pseudomonas sp. B11D7D]